MSHEGFPQIAQEQAPKEGIFHPDGSLNEVYLSEHFGLGAHEAMQPVAFGKYSGTVAQMLDSSKPDGCPVGGMIANAYQEKGIEGVAEKFQVLQMMDTKFTVKISEATVDREFAKKKSKIMRMILS